jgi:hypothetical protein
MTHQEIVEMCDAVMNRKAEEYASPEERWHNFYQSAVLFQNFYRYFVIIEDVSPMDCCLMFALKHYTSCEDIVNGKPATPEMVKEKAGDLLNYYLIYRAMDSRTTVVETSTWLSELCSMPRHEAMPWIVGYELLRGLK